MIDILKKEHRFLPLLFGLLSAEGLFFLFQLVAIKSDAKNSFIFGYSLAISAVIAFVLGLVLLFGFLALKSSQVTTLREKIVNLIKLNQKRVLNSLLIGFIFLLILLLIPEHNFRFLAGSVIRLSPLLYYFLCISLTSLLFGFLFIFHANSEALKQQFTTDKEILKSWIRWGLIVAPIAALLFYVYEYLVPIDYKNIWNTEFGVPLTSLHTLIVLVVLLFYGFINKFIPIRYRDVLIILVLWLGAVSLWSLQPMSESYFARKPLPPNGIILPYSDARSYDKVAQFILLGQGPNVIKTSSRPVFETYLAVLHLVAGQDYNQVMFLQIVLMAFLPGLIYWMGKYLNSPLAGVAGGVLLILKQSAAITVAKHIYTVHVRLMMTEILTMAGLILASFLLIRTLNKKTESTGQILWVGAIFGLTYLIRPGVVVPFLVCVGMLWFIYKNAYKKAIINGAFLVLGFLLVISPWMIRTQIVKGNVQFLNGKMGVVLKRWDLKTTASSEIKEPNQPGEENPLANIILETPARFYLNLRASLFALPSSMVLYSSEDIMLELIRRVDNKLNRIMPLDIFFAFCNLILLILGFVYAWHHGRWAGMIPLVVFLSYHLTNSLARSSGSRYLVPVDWVLLLYFAFGLVQITQWVFVLVSGGAALKVENVSQRLYLVDVRINFYQFIRLCALIILAGSFLIIFERLFPERYGPVVDENKLISSDVILKLNAVGITKENAELFLQSSDAALIAQGSLLYPEFGNKNEYDKKYLTNFDRLTFQLFSGGTVYKSVIPMLKTTPSLPVGESAIILGCRYAGKEKNIFTWGVIVSDPDEGLKLYTREPIAPLACPMPDVQCDETGCNNVPPSYP